MPVESSKGEWGRGQHELNVRYADVLGEIGLARYRRLAEAEWARIPSRGPGEEDDTDEDGDRFRVTSMMESLAQALNDVDLEIAVLSRDLSSAYGFLRLAQLCRDAGRDDEALDWAERLSTQLEVSVLLTPRNPTTAEPTPRILSGHVIEGGASWR